MPAAPASGRRLLEAGPAAQAHSFVEGALWPGRAGVPQRVEMSARPGLLDGLTRHGQSKATGDDTVRDAGADRASSHVSARTRFRRGDRVTLRGKT
jgi:hypothetical protein